MRCGLHPFRYVARDLGKPYELAGITADRIDDDRAPEARPVLAHAPSLSLEPSFFVRGRERPGRNSRGPIFLHVEAAEVMTDDLIGHVALNTFCTNIPCRDDAVLIELKDRIIDHRLHEVAEATFTFELPVLLQFALCHVARHHSKTDELTVVVAHGVDHD